MGKSCLRESGCEEGGDSDCGERRLRGVRVDVANQILHTNVKLYC